MVGRLFKFKLVYMYNVNINLLCMIFFVNMVSVILRYFSMLW